MLFKIVITIFVDAYTVTNYLKQLYLITYIMKQKQVYLEPQTELYDIKLESTVLSNGVDSVEPMNPVDGSWDDGDFIF